MFKRLVWFSSGAASGAAGSWWVRRRIRQQMQRYTPAGVREQAVVRLQRVRADAGLAVTEGRRLAEQVRRRA